VRSLTRTKAAALLCLALLPVPAAAGPGVPAGALAAAVPEIEPEVSPPTRPNPVPDQGRKGGKAWSHEACKVIYPDKAFDFRNRMFSFQPVYGKKSIDWTDKDYADLAALVAACSGVTFGEGEPFNAKPWPGMINVARSRILPVAEVARVVAVRAARMQPDAIRLPACDEFLQFKVDTYQVSDTSAALFGQSFLAMGMADLDRAVSYTNLCLAYLPEHAQIAGGWRKEVARDLLYRIMDRALIVQKRRQEWEAQPRYDTDLVLERDGVVLPTTMLSPDAREMIARFNRSSALRRPFSPEAIGQLLRMAEDVMRDDRSALDKLYAVAVKNRCQQEIFRKQ